MWVEIDEIEKRNLVKQKRFNVKPPLFIFIFLFILFSINSKFEYVKWVSPPGVPISWEDYFQDHFRSDFVLSLLLGLISYLLQIIFKKPVWELSDRSVIVCLKCGKVQYKGNQKCKYCESTNITDLENVKWVRKTRKKQ